MGTQAGLTQIELMLALLVVGLLAGVGVPAWSGSLEGARAASARADLLASLEAAAYRAGFSGTRAVLCPSLDAEHCSDDPDWSRGWLVFMDPNADRELDGGERVLRRQPALPGRVRLRSTAGRVRIVFQGNGGNAGSNVTFTLCDGRGAGRAKTLVIANDGRLRDGAPTATGIADTCVR
jgi:type IV fimbrial biogenesis protein FimT